MKLTYTKEEVQALDAISFRYIAQLSGHKRNTSLMYRVAAIEAIMTDGLVLKDAGRLFSKLLEDGLITEAYHDGFIQLTKFGKFVLAYAQNEAEIDIPVLENN